MKGNKSTRLFIYNVFLLIINKCFIHLIYNPARAIQNYFGVVNYDDGGIFLWRKSR